MDKVSRRLGVTIRIDIDILEKLEELAHVDKVRPAKKAELIIVDYINNLPVNEL